MLIAGSTTGLDGFSVGNSIAMSMELLVDYSMGMRELSDHFEDATWILSRVKPNVTTQQWDPHDIGASSNYFRKKMAEVYGDYVHLWNQIEINLRAPRIRADGTKELSPFEEWRCRAPFSVN